ncbi:response regulator, partial [bacterium 1XD42-8]
MFNIGICDDEKLTCEDLEEKVQKFGDKIQMKMNMRIWHSGEELCDALEEGLELDLLFLDIELITTNGVIIGDFIRNSLENVETEIIYISSKSSYAMSLFKIQPLEFLMKPLDEKKVWRAALRWVHIMEMKNKNFAYSIKGEYYKVPFKDIIYFYSDNKKVVIVLKNKKIHFNGKLKDVAKKVT